MFLGCKPTLVSRSRRNPACRMSPWSVQRKIGSWVKAILAGRHFTAVLPECTVVLLLVCRSRASAMCTQLDDVLTVQCRWLCPLVRSECVCVWSVAVAVWWHDGRLSLFTCWSHLSQVCSVSQSWRRWLCRASESSVTSFASHLHVLPSVLHCHLTCNANSMSWERTFMQFLHCSISHKIRKIQCLYRHKLSRADW